MSMTKAGWIGVFSGNMVDAVMSRRAKEASDAFNMLVKELGGSVQAERVAAAMLCEATNMRSMVEALDDSDTVDLTSPAGGASDPSGATDNDGHALAHAEPEGWPALCLACEDNRGCDGPRLCESCQAYWDRKVAEQL